MVNKIKFENLDLNSVLLYSSENTTEKELTEYGNNSVNSISKEPSPTDENDTDGASNVSSSPSSSSVLPPGYGAAIMMAFLAMIEYLNEVSQQSYQATIDSAQAMIGTNGQNGLISNWVKEGIQSAEQSGKQFMYQAIGALVGAAFSAAAVMGSVGGFAKNCTDGVGQGKYQTEKGALNEQLSSARNYKTMLSELNNPDMEAGSSSEAVNGGIEMRTKIEMDSIAQQRKQDLVNGVGVDSYKGADKDGNFSQADIDTRNAAKHLQPDERSAAVKKADERIENLEKQLSSFDAKQNIWVSLLGQFSQAGSGAGSAYGGLEASKAVTKSGIAKANADAIQQASQTTGKVEETAISSLQSSREQMGQIATAMAQALQAQVQDKA